MLSSKISYIVVFTSKSTLLRARLLHRDFRHCYVLVRRNFGQWVFINPFRDELVVARIGSVSGCELAKIYENMGHRVLIGSREKEAVQRTPFGIKTCVVTVKRILGFNSRWIQTPKQLYQALFKEGALPPIFPSMMRKLFRNFARESLEVRVGRRLAAVAIENMMTKGVVKSLTTLIYGGNQYV